MDRIQQLADLEKGKKSGMLRAWKAVSNRDHYRMVRASDLTIPDWVKKEHYWGDVERATERADDYGEMAGAYGFIALIVDKTISNKKHFSVVVFLERPGNEYSLYWIFRDEDLSRVTLGRHSGNVYLTEFRDGGTSRTCDVQWDRTQKKWACNLS